MIRVHRFFGALGLLVFLFVFTSSGCSSSVNLTSNDDTVGDVTSDDPSAPGSAFPVIDAVRARVRNESSARADVTLRFIRDDKVVHLAFVRVLPDTITTVVSPEIADVLELSGLNDRGAALDGAVFVFGVDFDEALPAEYIVVDEGVEPSPLPPVEAPGGRPELPKLVMVEPADDLVVSLGSTFTAKWSDTAGSPGALVTIYLQPETAVGEGDLIPLGPGVGAALDGINDELRVVVQNVTPGLYRVVGQVELQAAEEETLTELAIAPGRVRVELNPGNAAPTVQIRSPRGPIVLENGDTITIRWDDSDADDNATISFSLVSTRALDAAAESFAIGPAIAENPDGPRFDSATVVVEGILPGYYDLLATIDDGELIGTDRVQGTVRILAAAGNDTPRLQLVQPTNDLELEIGRSFLVGWIDFDENDDARISLLLDPDLENVALDGDEVLLAASLGEDAEGLGDQLMLGIPLGISHGVYRVVGVITDGMIQVLTSAPGLVRVGRGGTPPSGPQEGSGNPGGGRTVVLDTFPPLPPPPEPPADPPSPWTVTPLGSSDAVIVQAGDEVSVYSDRVDDRGHDRGRIYLSNLRYGGNTRVGTRGIPRNAVKTLSVPIEIIPNDAWPRTFDVEIETLLDDSVQIEVSDRPIWVVQEAEILDVGMVGLSCIPAGGVITVESGLSLDVTWYGGGLQEGEGNPIVQFWLSEDGTVPLDGVEDAAHRLIGQAPGSPHRVQATRFEVISPAPSETDAEVVEALTLAHLFKTAAASDVEYRLITVFDPHGVNRVVSNAFVDPLPVCDPGRSPDTDKQP